MIRMSDISTSNHHNNFKLQGRNKISLLTIKLRMFFKFTKSQMYQTMSWLTLFDRLLLKWAWLLQLMLFNVAVQFGVQSINKHIRSSLNCLSFILFLLCKINKIAKTIRLLQTRTHCKIWVFGRNWPRTDRFFESWRKLGYIMTWNNWLISNSIGWFHEICLST